MARAVGCRLPCLCLVRHGGCLSHRRLLIPQVKLLHGFQLLVELVHERYPGWDIQFDDVLFRGVIEILDERAQAVAMGGDEDSFSSLDVGRDGGVPLREESGNRILQRLRERQLIRLQICVSAIA